MAGRFSRKKRTGGTSWLLGLVLMLLLVGAIVLGASWVLRAAKSVGAQDAQKEPETARQAAPEASGAQQSVPAAPEITQADSAPEQTQALPAEQEPEPARVRLMALGDNLIHNAAKRCCWRWQLCTKVFCQTAERFFRLEESKSGCMMRPEYF